MRAIFGMLDEMPARDGPVACEAREIRGETWHGEKGYEPELEETLMCSRCLCFRAVLVDEGIGLIPFRRLCVCLVWLGFQFIFIVISSHTNCSINLYSLPCTMTLAIFGGGLGIHLSFDMCCWNEWHVLATNMLT